ncbi:hypothetical protein FACS1894172_08760 [Spirochaetia bacterium]|nr:hypothetical protein FACS1894164_12320 [Spirochaetia bacterium]GHU32334.1 hypothetical protein FACS1894172_08760 [Spirochaetia bacterium]
MKKNTKLAFVGLLALALTFGLTGCPEDEETETDPAAGAKTELAKLTATAVAEALDPVANAETEVNVKAAIIAAAQSKVASGYTVTVGTWGAITNPTDGTTGTDRAGTPGSAIATFTVTKTGTTDNTATGSAITIVLPAVPCIDGSLALTDIDPTEANKAVLTLTGDGATWTVGASDDLAAWFTFSTGGGGSGLTSASGAIDGTGKILTVTFVVSSANSGDAIVIDTTQNTAIKAKTTIDGTLTIPTSGDAGNTSVTIGA